MFLYPPCHGVERRRMPPLRLTRHVIGADPTLLTLIWLRSAGCAVALLVVCHVPPRTKSQLQSVSSFQYLDWQTGCKWPGKGKQWIRRCLSEKASAAQSVALPRQQCNNAQERDHAVGQCKGRCPLQPYRYIMIMYKLMERKPILSASIQGRNLGYYCSDEITVPCRKPPFER